MTLFQPAECLYDLSVIVIVSVNKEFVEEIEICTGVSVFPLNPFS